VSPGQRRDAIGTALQAAAGAGIGAIHEIGAPHLSRTEDFAAIAELGAERPGPSVVRYWGQLGAVDTARELGCRGAAGDLCVDGAFGSRTAALTSPYADADTSGYLYLDVAEIRDHVVACTNAGLQAGFHCIGDRAVGVTLDGFVQAASIVGVPALRAARHRLEHVELIDAAGIETLARLGVTASVQPAFDAAWGGSSDMYAARLGAERAASTNPFRSLADAGVDLAFGSDTPVTALDPWGSVRAAAWHRTPRFRLTPAEAFGAHTRGGWRAAGRRRRGSSRARRPRHLRRLGRAGRVRRRPARPRPGAAAASMRQHRGRGCRCLRAGRCAGMTSPRSTGKLALDPVVVRKARRLAAQAGRPIVELAKRHTTVSVERATLRLAGLSGADPDGIPWVNRLVDAVRGDVGLEHGVAMPVWHALARENLGDLTTLAEKASAGSVRFALPEGRDATRAKAAARRSVGAGLKRVDARRRERDRLVKRYGNPAAALDLPHRGHRRHLRRHSAGPGRPRGQVPT
jgi:hypothetical protein